jgi:para-nitrobenzyl esterase
METGMNRFGSPMAICALLTSAAVLMSACGSSDSSSDPSVVQTGQGPAKGTVTNGVSEFLGLPYAAPPVGQLRWKPPAAPAQYTGTYDASTMRSQCVQGSATAPMGSEDCLYLNIYRPGNASSTAALPVIFAIHGGGFAVGSSAFIDGTALAKNNNVIVVSINYRLNALGFLAHPALTAEDAQHASGNYGLLDQNAALSWVKRNIAAFGGDPGNITITGGSAGGISVFAHMASTMSAGLFAKAAPQSGGFTRVQATLAQSESDGVNFTSQWGCTTGSSADIAACLRNVPAAATLQNNPPAWLPIVDGRFLTTSTSVAFSTGQFNKVPIMTGFVNDEGTYFVAAAFDAIGQPVTSSAYVSTIQGFLGVDGNATAALYPLNQYKSPSQALARVYGDYRVICGIMQDTDNIARFVPSAFVYQFSEETPYSTNSLISMLPPTNIDYGAFHGSDTDYWFAQMVNPTASQTQLATTMSASIANFAKTGNPGVTNAPQWQQYSAAQRQVFSFGDTLTANFDAYTAHQCSYWYQQTPSTHL